MSDKDHNRINGAQKLVESLEQAQVEVCFANPGTSEMHFVAALDGSDNMRAVLCLAETVVTGAADGYASMAGKPGVTLLHTGPGLGNGIANLHNAKKALSPIVNIVGEHATYHVEYDAPLTADIEALAAPVSSWVGTCRQSDNVESMAYEAVENACQHPGRVATLVLPADAAWSPVTDQSNKSPAPAGIRQAGKSVSTQQLQGVADILKGNERAVMILTGQALSEQGLQAASRLQQATGVALRAQTSNGRLPRGAGRVFIEPVPYRVETAMAVLSEYQHIIRVGAKAPVAFFAYPDKPSKLYPEHAQVSTLAGEDDDGVQAMERLVDLLNAGDYQPLLEQRKPPAQLPARDDAINGEAIGLLLAQCLPPDAIVVDEAISNAATLPQSTRGANAHDWLQICGGAIGDGFPLATGAAIACPERQVVTLQADGSGMYSLQALWTQAREELNITTLVLANRSYAILEFEFHNVGAHRQGAAASDGPGKTARDLMELDRPQIDWVALAGGMGVSGTRVQTFGELHDAFEKSLSHQGPYLIEVLL